MLQAEAMARTAQAVADFAKEALQKGAEQLACVGTMALRQAENAQSFFDRVHALCGVDVRVLSGEEEARLCYRAALMDVQGEKGTLAVIDSGGGSTEIALGSAASPQMRASLPIGAVSVTETYLRPFATAEALDNAQAAMRTAFARSGICPRAQTVVAAGGTATTMAAVMLRLAPYACGLPSVSGRSAQSNTPAGAATATARPSTNSVRSSSDRTSTRPSCGRR